MENEKKRFASAPGGKQLRAWLDTKSIKRATFGEFLGVSKHTVNQWIGGMSRPRDIDRVKLEELTGVSFHSWWTEEERTELRHARIAIRRLKTAKPVEDLSAWELMQGRV